MSSDRPPPLTLEQLDALFRPHRVDLSGTAYAPPRLCASCGKRPALAGASHCGWCAPKAP